MKNKEIAMEKASSTFAGNGFAGLRAAMIAAVLTLCVTGALAGPSGQAGKAAATGAVKVVLRETVEEAAERAAREAAEKVARGIAAKTAKEAAERAARKAVGKGVGSQFVKQITRPKAILAAGAGTAMFVGSHNASTGVRHAAEDVGKGVRDVAEKHPEMLPKVIREGTRPAVALFRAVECAAGLAFICLAAWFFAAPLRLLRARIAARAERAMRETQHVRQAQSLEEIIDGEFEIRSA